ncbi:unnamed protein product [Boreogadus saida]
MTLYLQKYMKYSISRDQFTIRDNFQTCHQMEHLELSAHLEPSENIWNHQRTSGTIRKHLEFSENTWNHQRSSGTRLVSGIHRWIMDNLGLIFTSLVV